MSCHPASTAKQLTTQLSAAFSVLPKQTWVDGFLTTQKLTTPFPSLLATAKVRFLNTDISPAFSIPARASSTTPPTASAANTTAKALPQDIHDAELAERRLAGPIALQVQDVQDISHSRWSQLEDVEAAERGETTKGREIIRVVPTERQTDGGGGDMASEGNAAGAGAGGKSSSGTCKLLLQDAHGVQVWAVELRKVKGVRVGMNIGTKVDLHA